MRISLYIKLLVSAKSCNFRFLTELSDIQFLTKINQTNK